MNSRSRLAPVLLAVLLAGNLAPRLHAQGDPAEAILEVARRIDRDLKEIDRLLQESAKQGQPRSAPTERLKASTEKSRAVEAGIDELIDKLNEMKNQSSSQSSESESQSQSQSQSQQQSQGQSQGLPSGQRRENQTPDFVQQPKEGQGEPQPQGGEPKPGEQQGQPPGNQQPGETGQPDGPNGTKDPGQNRTGQNPRDGETGPGNPGQGTETWGELQGYTNFQKNRGSMPKVPEKYRKYWEAWLKQKQAGQDSGR